MLTIYYITLTTKEILKSVTNDVTLQMMLPKKKLPFEPTSNQRWWERLFVFSTGVNFTSSFSPGSLKYLKQSWCYSSCLWLHLPAKAEPLVNIYNFTLPWPSLADVHLISVIFYFLLMQTPSIPSPAACSSCNIFCSTSTFLLQQHHTLHWVSKIPWKSKEDFRFWK